MKKTVLVTGASRGLGLAIATRLRDDGFKVIATARTRTDDISALEASGDVVFYPYDMMDTDGLHGFVREVTGAHGPLYGLVNNAAVGLEGVLATMHANDIERLMRVNVTSPILLTKSCVRGMLRAGKGGRILNVTSIIASTGFNGLSVYGASKAALEGFTRSLARELGAMNITVNALAPGYMSTEMTKGLQGDKLKSIMRRSPLGVLASVEDVANGAGYLMSEGASRVTGTVLTIDAGSTA